jgi:hypothetical protein
MGRRRVEASIWVCWQQRRPVFSEILPRRISKTISMKISVVSLSTENELVRNVLLAVLASLAKLEREKISQRMKAGLETSDREKLRNPRLAEVHPSIEKPMLDEQGEPPPNRNPSCVAAEESGRRLARAVLESMDAIKLDAVVYPLEQPAALIGALNSPHDKSADKRQSLETKPISRGTRSSNPFPPVRSLRTIGSVRGFQL